MIKSENKILFWQARIKITQAPEIFKPEQIPESAVPFYQKSEDMRTFLYDPFGENPPASYGVEFNAGNNVEVVFFTKSKSKNEANKLGNAWLSNLKFRFRGLDGIVNARLINSNNSKDNEGLELLEIVLPEGLITSKINVIDRFVSAFYYKNSQSVRLILLWQRKIRPKNNPEGSNMYKLRIFITYDLSNLDNKNHLKLKGILDFLSMEIETNTGKRAAIVKPLDISYPKIVEGNIFNNSEEVLNAVVTEDVNFDFPKNIPLPRLPILNYENVRYIDLNEEFKKQAIEIGNHIKNGVITVHKTYVPINKLPQDLVVFGKSGCGKTYFLARFIKELSSKAKDVGILVLNIAK